MDTNNYCLGWQLKSFKHNISDVVHVSNILENFVKFLNFVTFNWEFPVMCDLGKKDTIFNWEYDPISAIK